jgi:hypothetical protein
MAMAALADDLASIDIVVKISPGRLWISRLNQERCWSNTQARLCARSVVWRHMSLYQSALHKSIECDGYAHIEALMPGIDLPAAPKDPLVVGLIADFLEEGLLRICCSQGQDRDIGRAIYNRPFWRASFCICAVAIRCGARCVCHVARGPDRLQDRPRRSLILS